MNQKYLFDDFRHLKTKILSDLIEITVSGKLAANAWPHINNSISSVQLSRRGYAKIACKVQNFQKSK